MKRRTVISMEQALSMSYATLRFAHLGWRVIRLEATPSEGDLPGDPNRYIGETVGDDDRRTYFVAPNVGKECICLNLKMPQGRALLHRIIRELGVDIFCCNTLPSRYKMLGMDYETLDSVRPGIIWAAISAMGPDYPDTPGYDPAMQAMAGFMETTGEADGPPMLSGIPIIDLKAGDEIYSAVLLALAEKLETGRGRSIHVSMLQAAASWLITTLPLLDFDCDPSEVTRCGNEHRKFVPVNSYPTKDGFIFIAIGNDVQWRRLTGLAGFASVDSDVRRTNAGRRRERDVICRDIARITRRFTTAELAMDFARAKIPHARINTLAQVRELKAIKEKLTSTRAPNGRLVRLPPMGTDVPEAVTELAYAPSYNEHTCRILEETGISKTEIPKLKSDGVIP